MRNRAGLMKLLSFGVPNDLLGKEFVRDFNVPKKKQLAEDLLKSDYTSPKNVPSLQQLESAEWEWEVYAPHAS